MNESAAEQFIVGHCDTKSQMGTGRHGVAGFTKCVAECNFDCRNVRVYRGGPGAWPDFR